MECEARCKLWQKILEVFPEKILGDFFVLLMCPRKSRFVNFLKGIYVFSSQSLSINVCLFRMCLQGGLGALSCLVSALRKRESLCLGDQYSKSDLIRWMNDLQVSGFWENITYLISHCFSIELCIYNIIMFTVYNTEKISFSRKPCDLFTPEDFLECIHIQICEIV